MSQKRKRTPSPIPEASTDVAYYCSSTIEDRQSKFLGFYSPTLSYKDLQKLEQTKSASHKIAAWRRESNQQSLTSAKRYVTGFDDDGEKYAGKKVEQALNNAAVTGSCVVARWWGGIMLGPARFEHIEACAREAIQRWRDSVTESAAKKQRVEMDEVDRQKLIKALTARDQNIAVLRKLAAQKEKALEDLLFENAGSKDESPATILASAPPTATIDYGGMPLERLRALDKARDATVAFLLKRIDKVEADLRLTEA